MFDIPKSLGFGRQILCDEGEDEPKSKWVIVVADVGCNEKKGMRFHLGVRTDAKPEEWPSVHLIAEDLELT